MSAMRVQPAVSEARCCRRACRFPPMQASTNAPFMRASCLRFSLPAAQKDRPEPFPPEEISVVRTSSDRRADRVHFLREDIMFRSPFPALIALAALMPSGTCLADAADPSSAVQPVEYRSPFETYRRHAVGPVASWRESNERVASGVGAHGSVDPASADPHAGQGLSIVSSGHDHGAHAAEDARRESAPVSCVHHGGHHDHGAMKCAHSKGGGHDGKEGGDAHQH